MFIGQRPCTLAAAFVSLLLAVDGFVTGFNRLRWGPFSERSNTVVMGLRERLARDRIPTPSGTNPSGIESLYSSEDPVEDRLREFRPKLVRLGTTRSSTSGPKSEKQRQLDSLIRGEWTLQETSLERPTSLEMQDKSFKPRQVTYREELLFDFGGSIMITNHDTMGYGIGWGWERLEDMYNPPTLHFRINRKGVGIEFDEYSDDINRSPSMFFYHGSFVDGEFKRIEGTITRNRDILTDANQQRVVVNVGSFRLLKVD